MEKTISIIIPTYNMEALLKHTLDSLIVSDANMQKLEVLVINDGSKDSSLAIAQEYEKRFPNTFRAIDKPNGNYGSCVNKGMELATGKYVKVLDADDCFDTDVFDSYIEYLFSCDSDLIVCDFDVVNENWKTEDKHAFKLPTDRIFTLNEIPKTNLIWLWHHSITYRTSVVRNSNYKQTEGISYTDDEWIYKPMIGVKSVSYYPYCLYKYLRGREGQTFDPKVIKRTLNQRLTVAYSLVDFYTKNSDKFSHCCDTFMLNKIVVRLRALYDLYIVKYTSSENKSSIVEFDKYLFKKSHDLYVATNNLKNSYGFHYIRQWRNMNYNNYAPTLIFVRFIRTLKQFIVK